VPSHSTEYSAALTKRLRTEDIAWVTTVAPDGQPQSSPIWFLWTDDTFLVYAQPGSWKVRNIRAHPQVSVHLNSDESGGNVATFEGTAQIDPDQPLAHQHAAYVRKYRAGIASIDMSPEQMSAEYSVALVITPSRFRVY